MPGCYDMKKGESYVCKKCGFEVKVVKQCREDCGCKTMPSSCTFVCCGKELVKKS